jgi:hypothetical protein
LQKAPIVRGAKARRASFRYVIQMSNLIYAVVMTRNWKQMSMRREGTETAAYTYTG